VPIYVDDYSNIVGYGLEIKYFVLTAFHVVENSTIIVIRKKKYKLLFNLDEYDIAILIEEHRNNTLENFLSLFFTFIKQDIINIKDYNKYNNQQFELFDKTNIIFDDICLSHLKTNIMPSIPIYTYNVQDKDYYRDFSGFSGSSIKFNDRYSSMVISQKASSREITGLPYDIIYNILYSYSINKCLYYFPVVLDENNKCTNHYNLLYINDQIVEINNIIVENDNLMFDSNLGIHIKYDTYILLYNTEHIGIKIKRKTKKYDKIYLYKIKLKEFKYKNIFINYKNKLSIDTKEYIRSLEISELSEEFLIQCIHNNIAIPEINYQFAYNNKKLLYISDITDFNVYYEFEKNKINIRNNIYILNKISGKKINNINDIQKYINSEKLTIELLDSNSNIIRIKI